VPATRITSTANPRLKAAARLRGRRERDKTGLTLIDGVRETMRALQGGAVLREVFIESGLLVEPEAKALLERLGEESVPVLELGRDAFAKLAYGDRLDGVVAVAETPLRTLADLVLPAEPLIGVIEPGVRKALMITRNNRVGVIGTEATIQSRAYTKALKRRSGDIEVYSRACPLFVPLVEEGWIDNRIAAMTVEAYLGSLKQSGIDTLILGCTHYPLLKKAIGNYMGAAVELIDSAEEIVKEVGMALEKQSLARRDGIGNHSFFVTDAPDRFIKVGGRFLGEKVESAVRIER